MEYGSVVLDMDGVVLNFEGGNNFRWKYDAVRSALEEMGVEPGGMERSELDAFLGDRGFKECVKACKEAGIDPGQTWELIAEKTTEARMCMMDEGRFSIYPDASEALEQLHSDDVQLGLISNAPEKAVEAMVDHFGMRDRFEFFRGITDFEDLTSRKPHPDHLEFARAELKRSPFIYAGDAESDVLAAKRADMDSVWIRRDGGSIDTRPDYVLESLDGQVALLRGEN